MSVTVMMGSMLKLEETITVKVDGNGPIGLIMADADAHGNVRAYCDNPHCHFEYVDSNKLNVKATVGDAGFINVIKDLKLKEPFVGSIPIINGELGEDFAYYFSVSEQVPSAVALGVLVDENNNAISAGGFIVQLLPNTPDLVIDLLEERIKELPPISKMLADGMTPTDIVKEIGGDSVKILDTIPVNFKCKCSRDRFERGLISLGYSELSEIIESDGHAHTVCHFCGNEYDFSKEELESLLEKTK
jgi:molecular chaperone Hsp33